MQRRLTSQLFVHHTHTHTLSRSFSSTTHPSSSKPSLLLHLPPCPVLDLSHDEPDWGDIFAQQTPLILKGLASSWPACSTWQSSEYLMERFGKVEVPVEVGGDYMSNKTKHLHIPFAKAIRKLSSLEQQRTGKGSRGSKVHYYVAQHSLLAFPGMLHDLRTPEICSSTGSGGETCVCQQQRSIMAAAVAVMQL